GLFHRHHDDVADGGIAAVRTAQNLDALHPARAGVVSDIQIRLHLDHCLSPDLWGRAEAAPGYRSNRVQAWAVCAASSVTTVQRFVFEIGAHSTMRTLSPVLNWFSAS